jgi:hypothetical protein
LAAFLLVLAAIIELIRGLACFFSSQALADILGLEYLPETLVFANPLGTALFTFAVMFFIASEDPGKHRIVVNMGALFYGLATISFILAFLRLGSIQVFWWIMAAITLVLFVLFVLVRPKKQGAQE